MADRVSVSIAIGGTLAADLRDSFIAIIADEGLSTEWDGPDFDVSHVPTDEALRLYAHEVAWGRLNVLEAFCVAHGLAFSRWSGSYPGQFGPEIAVFTGSGEVRLFAADEEEQGVLGRATAERLGSFAAILAWFDAAAFVPPPLRLGQASSAGSKSRIVWTGCASERASEAPDIAEDRGSFVEPARHRGTRDTGLALRECVVRIDDGARQSQRSCRDAGGA